MLSMMDSFRKWFYKPRRDDTSYLAQFFYADEALNLVAAELGSFDGRREPERCTYLVSHLRQRQDEVLNICNRIMDEMIPNERADRDFRVKFPDDVMQDNLGGQLWFGAECLAAGSSILNREVESVVMRPLAKALTKSLEEVRCLLREAALRSPHACHPQYAEPTTTQHIISSLKLFDTLLAEFELAYVSAMVPVKSALEYEMQQCVIVLFSETLHRALAMGLLSQEMVDQCDPALMFTIPRLAIVAGLIVYPHGPLSLSSDFMSDMFRPFRTLLMKIRELLWTLTEAELERLEKMLCSSDEPSVPPSSPSQSSPTTTSLCNSVGRYIGSKSSKRKMQNQEAYLCEEKWVGEGEEEDARWKSIPCDCECSEGRGPQDWVSSPSRNPSPALHIPPSTSHTHQSSHPSCEFYSGSFDSSSSSSSCKSSGSTACNSVSSGDTSSFNSRSNDEMEVALAMEAAEFNSIREARARFKSSEDLLHRLFVCISGVADQLQTNFAGDLRNILKAVFLINASDSTEFDTSNQQNNAGEYCEQGEDVVATGVVESEGVSGESPEDWLPALPPPWVPDQEAPVCMACKAPFTVLRRRHHCRNCGKVFCARCSSNSVPLPRFGHIKPVRVCNRCFIYQVTPFTLDSSIPTAASVN